MTDKKICADCNQEIKDGDIYYETGEKDTPFVCDECSKAEEEFVFRFADALFENPDKPIGDVILKAFPDEVREEMRRKYKCMK